jgi:glutamate carboxypeptidase
MSQELFNFLNVHMPKYLEHLCNMVSINSFTANSAGVNRLGDYTAEMFAGLGFQAEQVPSINPNFGKHLFLWRQASNLSRSKQEQSKTDPSSAVRKGEGSLARVPAAGLGNDAPFLALLSHLDTVFPPEEETANDFFYREEGDRLYGPGTIDIKGGTLMMYIVLHALQNCHPDVFEHTNWLVALDASEETLSEDFGALCRQRIPTDALAGLIFEGGTPDAETFPIVVARKGRCEFRVTAEGRGAHAGNFHHLGANAIQQLAHTVEQIASFTDYGKQLTFNVGVISGGSVVNRVPHYAEALVEMRAFSPSVFNAGVARMLSLDGSSGVTSWDGFPCCVSVKVLARNAPWPRNADTDRLYDVWAAAAETLDLAIQTEERGGLSDGNLLWQHIACIDGLGPTGANAHCSERSDDGTKDQEYCLASSFVPKAMLNIAAILSLIDGAQQEVNNY